MSKELAALKEEEAKRNVKDEANNVVKENIELLELRKKVQSLTDRNRELEKKNSEAVQNSDIVERLEGEKRRLEREHEKEIERIQHEMRTLITKEVNEECDKQVEQIELRYSGLADEMVMMNKNIKSLKEKNKALEMENKEYDEICNQLAKHGVKQAEQVDELIVIAKGAEKKFDLDKEDQEMILKAKGKDKLRLQSLLKEKKELETKLKEESEKANEKIKDVMRQKIKAELELVKIKVKV